MLKLLIKLRTYDRLDALLSKILYFYIFLGLCSLNAFVSKSSLDTFFAKLHLIAIVNLFPVKINLPIQTIAFFNKLS